MASMSARQFFPQVAGVKRNELVSGNESPLGAPLKVQVPHSKVGEQPPRKASDKARISHCEFRLEWWVMVAFLEKLYFNSLAAFNSVQKSRGVTGSVGQVTAGIARYTLKERDHLPTFLEGHRRDRRRRRNIG